MYPTATLKLPEWVDREIGPARLYPTIEDRMALAIRLSEQH